MSDHTKNSDYLNREKDLVNLTDNLPVGIYRTTAEGKIIYANLALANMLEYSLEEIYNISAKDLYLENTERKFQFQQLSGNSEASSSLEISLKTKSGKTIIVKDNVQVVKDKNNNIEYFIGVLEDVSEKKKAEEALKESQARFKILTELTIEGIIIHDNGVIIDTNPSIQKMMGYNAEDLKGKNVFEFIHPDSKELAKRNIESHFTGTYEIKLIQKDKSIIFAEVEVKNVLIGNKEYRVVAVRDTTKRKNIEKEILSLSTAITQSPASVIITNLDGNIEYVNPKFTEVTGYTYEEAIGKNPSILKTEHTVSDDYKEMWETITSGEIWRGEFLNKRKDGTHYWELASISPIIDEKGNIIKYLAIKEDITERKKTEDALIKSEKDLLQANATKNMFFSIIAHDLKGPIGNFMQLLSLLKENFNDISNDEKLDYLNILTSMSSKTNNLLEDLLLWARIQMNTLDFSVNTANIKKLTKNSVGIVEEKAKEKNIEIENLVESLNVEINESSVKTVIRNLLSNAIKFSHKNSPVVLKSKILKGHKTIEISVKDNGVGIPKESINNLFKIETSFSTYGTEKEKGSGLGLILCKELVEKNGGKIRVESEEDAGSTFYFTLPLKK
ncbi:MAG: PAS domain-containing sensor histidine kinase [Bacteroidales bacterium]|nr:PAS domain-containing sensor histidine kinase [Bacteroidales bacterium]